MEKISIKQAAKWLLDNDDFLILTHKRPDGDTVGSAGALVRALRKLGKRSFLYENSEITDKYMPFAQGFFAEEGFEQKKIISVDIASLSQFPLGGEKYRESVDLCIDHHMSNSGFAERICLYDTASCGEIVFDIIMELAGGMDKDTADCIYTAVSTDTGCFAYANTTANTFRVAGQAVELGADLPRLNKILFRTKTKRRADFDGYTYSNMRYYYDGRMGVNIITMDLRKEMGLTEDDLDDVASIPTGIEGVVAGITIKEQPDGCKISVRTVGDVNANNICAAFGGGGHRQAAGCFIEGSVNEAEEKLIEAVGKELR